MCLISKAKYPPRATRLFQRSDLKFYQRMSLNSCLGLADQGNKVRNRKSPQAKSSVGTGSSLWKKIDSTFILAECLVQIPK